MVRFGEAWVTPPVESGCLPGVFRQRLLDDGIVDERVVTLDQLRSADEIAVTNAVRGWRKAVLVDG
jgi:branched-subunit amino acid aminotransferase/4-amino-4-deoxychorismate lyase